MDNLQKLESNIKYKFKDEALLRAALRHSSLSAKTSDSSNRSFDRLEFLGDRVLNLTVAEILYKNFPTESEGDLAHRYTALVCFETCSFVAKNVHLDKYLKVASGTSFDDLRILCDALEAVIGAMFLDGGLDPCRGFVDTHWKDLFLKPVTPPQDPKSMLQEMIQSKGGKLPEYVVMEKRGSEHNPVFSVSVYVDGWAPVKGVGQSRKAAEKDAAARLLELMGA
ncbi:MAG: ribonuclease III [Holosporales bacterium]|jgi:ribonuclease-3|nr:ribonuclease III [Holosporales bacterium]